MNVAPPVQRSWWSASRQFNLVRAPRVHMLFG